MNLRPLNLYLFGPLRIERDGAAVVTRRRKAQALLAYLAVTGQPHSRDALATLLWPEFSQSQARTNLRRELAELRTLLGEARLLDNRVTVALNREPPFALDLADFQQHLAQARHCPHLGHPAETHVCPACLPHLSQAAALYSDDFLAGFTLPDSPTFDDWHFFQADGLRQTLAQLLERLVQGHTAAQQVADAIPFARRWVALDPLHEPAHCALMLVYELAGQHAAALRQYETCVRVLDEELGALPSAETTALVEQIRGGHLAAHKEKAAIARQPWAPAELPAFLTQATEAQRTQGTVVARERELAHLQSALADAKAGQGRPLFVSGDAGQGKTTLLEEFTRRALIDDPALLVVSGHGNAYTGIGDPYLPFRAALSLLLGDVEAQVAEGRLTPPHARRLWAAMALTLPLLAEHAPDLAGNFVAGPALLARAAPVAGNQRGWLTRLEQATAAALTTQMKQQQIFAQVTALLQAIAAQRPLVLILEDLHWADASSVSLFFHLSRQIGPDPILIVGTYRPNEVAGWDNQPHPLAGVLAELKRHYGDIWIDLTDIDMQHGRAFVDAYLDAQPNRLAETFRRPLFACTAGHPLFTVELFHDLQVRGAVQLDREGRWVAAQRIDWDKVPTKVEGVIEGRLAALDAELRRALMIASVEGESFTAEITAQIQGSDLRTLMLRLHSEVDRQHHLIIAQGLERVGQHRLSTYRFRHQLFQKYLYNSLTEAERSYLHEDIGNALETLYSDQPGARVVELARHFQAAGINEKAIDYLQIAAQQSIQSSAYTEAISHLHTGLGLLNMAPKTPQHTQYELTLQLALGQAQIATKGYARPEVAHAFQRANELCRALGDTAKLFPILHGLYTYYLVRADLQTAHELTEQMWSLAQRETGVDLLLIAHRALGFVLLQMGELTASRTHLAKASALYDPQQHNYWFMRYGDFDSGVINGCLAACTLWYLGYPDQMLQQLDQSIALAYALSHPFNVAAALTFAGFLHQFRREIESAKMRAAEVLALSTAHRFPIWVPLAMVIQGWTLVEEDKAKEGITQIRQALTGMADMGTGLVQPLCLVLLAEAYGKNSQIDQGLTVLEEALALVAETGERIWEAELYRIKGELYLMSELTEVAENCYLQAIAVASHQQAKSWELRATMSLCRLWQKQGKYTAAQQRLAAIIGWFTEGFDTADLIAAKALLATLA